MKVAVVGTGYVGLCSGVVFAEIGHQVCCIDQDAEKVEMLQKGISPIYEPGVQELIDRHSPTGALSFTDNIGQGIQGAEVVFIAVGTPETSTGEANMIYVENVAEKIAKNLDGYKVIVEKSTVPVHTGNWIRVVLERNNTAGHPFDVASNPEFLREGSAIEDSLNPDRIVVGTDSERAGEVLRKLYAPIIERSAAPFLLTDIATAELIKHASNAFLATKISFVNALSDICDRCGADVKKVAEGMGLDKRIGPAFLSPGVGYGGSCFPKDVNAFIHICKELGYDHQLLKAVRAVNEGQRDVFVRKIKDELWNLHGKRIAVWGLSFKPNTDDLRNAPSRYIIDSLLKHEAEVVAYDPVAMDKARQALPPEVMFAESALQAAEGADCVAVVTDWEEFAAVDLEELKKRLRYPIVIDGRNMFDRETMETAGFTYRGMGV